MDEIAVMIESMTSEWEYQAYRDGCQGMLKILRSEINWVLEQSFSAKHPLYPIALEQHRVILESYAELRELTSRLGDEVRWDGSSTEIADLKDQRLIKLNEIYHQQRALIDTLDEILKTPVDETEKFYYEHPYLTTFAICSTLWAIPYIWVTYF
jgi:hypothetical protein